MKMCDTKMWGVVDRDTGYLLLSTVSFYRSKAIEKFNKSLPWLGGYKCARRKGHWIARRLFTEARP